MKIFIINLKRSSDRKEKLQRHIDALFAADESLRKHLKFGFFEAVDAQKGEHLAFSEHFNDKGSKLIRGGGFER